MSWPFRHIRWKIIVPYAVLTALLAAVGSYLATDLVTGSLSERFDNQLAESARVASDSVVQKERTHLEGVRTISFTEGVGEAARAGDAEVLRKLVEPLAVNNAVERVEVLGVSGERLIDLIERAARTLDTVAPHAGYGERDPEAVYIAARDQFPQDMKLQERMEVHADSPEGPVTFTVVEVRDDGAVLDGNHPLAGKTLHFDVEIVEVRGATEAEIDHGHVH